MNMAVINEEKVMKIYRYIISVILAVLLLAGCGADRGAVTATQDDSEIISPETTVQETEEAPAEETQTVEAPAELTDLEKYGVSPISYDLSNLPPMENKLYAVWDGKIYFRQYSDEDMEEGGLWSEFDAIADTEKELMCMEPDGSIVQVGTCRL